MFLSVGANTNSPQLQQKIPVRQGFLHIAGAENPHPFAVAAKALRVEYGQIHLFQNKHILGFHVGIPHHGLILFLSAAVVPFTIATISAEGITIYIDWLMGTLCAGNIGDDDMVAIYLLNPWWKGCSRWFCWGC